MRTLRSPSLHPSKLGCTALHPNAVRAAPRVEEMLSSKDTGEFCHGDSPTMADCCLIPQARRTYIAVQQTILQLAAHVCSCRAF